MNLEPIYLEFIRPLIERQKDGNLSVDGVPNEILNLFYGKRLINKNGSLTQEGREAYQKYQHEKEQNTYSDRPQTIYQNIKTA